MPDVSLTEDMTGEFFGTFLVPSLVHQDPHYHREPFMPIKHRILHAIVQVVWSQSYTGKPMFNYANIVGGIATAVVSNTFVPGPNRQGFGNTAQRLALAFAISPSGNFIEEFVPDLASHVNLQSGHLPADFEHGDVGGKRRDAVGILGVGAACAIPGSVEGSPQFRGRLVGDGAHTSILESQKLRLFVIHFADEDVGGFGCTFLIRGMGGTTPAGGEDEPGISINLPDLVDGGLDRSSF